MNGVAFCDSARKNGNTRILLEAGLRPLAEAGSGLNRGGGGLAGTGISGCKAGYGCYKNKDNLGLQAKLHGMNRD